MPTYSKKQKEEYKSKKQQESQELLEQAVDNLMSTEGFRKYLVSRARFHKYSFNNTILIAMQRPDATMVMGRGGKDGKTGWKSLSRTVKADDNAPITIFAPVPVYERDEKKNIVMENGKKKVRFVWFKTVPVFDIEQTEGEPLPEPPKTYGISGDTAEEYLYRLVRFAKAIGQPVTFVDAAQAKGLAIDKSLPINAQVHIITRELAGKVDTDLTDYGKPERDAIREAATFLACRQMGLDTSGVAVPTLATLSGLVGETPKHKVNLVRDFAAKVDEIANVITEGVLL